MAFARRWWHRGGHWAWPRCHGWWSSLLTLAHATSTPKPCSGCCAAGTQHSHNLCAFADIYEIIKPGCKHKLVPRIWHFSLSFAGNAKGLQSRHQTQADDTWDLGPQEDPREWELHVGHRKELWVTAQSQNSKEPLGSLCQSRGYGKTPGILCSSNTSGIFWPRSGFAVMKRFQCPQGEKEKKRKRREKERVVMHEMISFL